MARNYVQPGKTISAIAPTGGVTSGNPYFIGGLFGVALATAAAAAAFEFGIEGVYTLAKTTSQTWVAGDRLYWDFGTSKATNVAGSGSKLIGTAGAAAASADTTGAVRLNGVNVNVDIGTGAAATSKNTAGAVTLTAAEVLGGAIVADPNGAGRTYTFPTAALLVAAIAGAKVGDVFTCLITNGADAAETITLQEGSGGTWDANQTAASRVIGQNGQKLVRIRLTNVTAASEAYTLQA